MDHLSKAARAILTLDEHYPTPKRVFLWQIIDAVAAVYSVSRNDILSDRRVKKICEARQVYFWVARKFTTHSYPQIGRYCGGKDHSTVMHGSQKIDTRFHQYRARIAIVLEKLGINSEVAA